MKVHFLQRNVMKVHFLQRILCLRMVSGRYIRGIFAKTKHKRHRQRRLNPLNISFQQVTTNQLVLTVLCLALSGAVATPFYGATDEENQPIYQEESLFNGAFYQEVDNAIQQNEQESDTNQDIGQDDEEQPTAAVQLFHPRGNVFICYRIIFLLSKTQWTHILLLKYS